MVDRSAFTSSEFADHLLFLLSRYLQLVQSGPRAVLSAAQNMALPGSATAGLGA